MYNIKPTCLFESHVILEIKKTHPATIAPITRFENHVILEIKKTTMVRQNGIPLFESHVMEDTLTGVLFLCSKYFAPKQRPKRSNFHQWRFPR